MKTILILTTIALTGCSAFTGIRQDAPPEWSGMPNPRDTPEFTHTCPPSEGSFGH